MRRRLSCHIIHSAPHFQRQPETNYKTGTTVHASKQKWKRVQSRMLRDNELMHIHDVEIRLCV